MKIVFFFIFLKRLMFHISSQPFTETSRLLAQDSIIKTKQTQITLPVRRKAASKPLLKCQSLMDVKILVNVVSSKSAIEMTFIWRVKRSVMSLRPPPGGHIAVTKSWIEKEGWINFSFMYLTLSERTGTHWVAHF